MKSRAPQLALSFAIAIGLTVAIAFLTDDAPLEFANAVFAPGMLVAALVFPQGAESDHANLYLALAGLITAILLTWPVMKLGQLFSYWRHSQEARRTPYSLGC